MMYLYEFRIVFLDIVMIIFVQIFIRSTQADKDSSDSSLVEISEELKSIILKRNDNDSKRIENVYNNNARRLSSSPEQSQEPSTSDRVHKKNYGAEPTPADSEEIHNAYMDHMGYTRKKHTTVNEDTIRDLNVEETNLINPLDTTSPDYIESAKHDSDKNIEIQTSVISHENNINQNSDQKEDGHQNSDQKEVEILQSPNYDETHQARKQSHYIKLRRKHKENEHLPRQRTNQRRYSRRRKHQMRKISDFKHARSQEHYFYYSDDETRPDDAEEEYDVQFRHKRRNSNGDQDAMPDNINTEIVFTNTKEENAENEEVDENYRRQNDEIDDVTPNIVSVNEDEQNNDIFDADARRYNDQHLDDTTNYISSETHLENADKDIEPLTTVAQEFIDEDQEDVTESSNPETIQASSEKNDGEAIDSNGNQENNENIEDFINVMVSDPLTTKPEEENDKSDETNLDNNTNLQKVTHSESSSMSKELDKSDAKRNKHKQIQDDQASQENPDEDNQPSKHRRNLGGEPVKMRVGLSDFCIRIRKPQEMRNSVSKLSSQKSSSVNFRNIETSPTTIKKNSFSTKAKQKVFPTIATKKTTTKVINKKSTAKTSTTPKKKPPVTGKIDNKNKAPIKGNVKTTTKQVTKKGKKGRRMNDEEYENVPNKEPQSAEDNIDVEKSQSNGSDEKKVPEVYIEIEK